MSVAREALDNARDKAEEALRKLQQHPETAKEAEILSERFDELKQRHEQLRRGQSADAENDEASPARTPRLDDSPKCMVTKAEDGSMTCTLLGPDGEPIAESFTMKVPQDDDENPIEYIRAVAEDFVDQAMSTIERHSDQLRDFQLEHLEGMYESLEAQREKMEKHIGDGSSDSVTELVATFYFSDALRFSGAVQLMVAQTLKLDTLSELNTIPECPAE